MKREELERTSLTEFCLYLRSSASSAVDSSSIQVRSRGAVRSARHPVKVEAAGSNPAGNALFVEQALGV
jgi:hypothetical protein